MNSADIILFKGDGLFSMIITALPGADYSHVGLFVTQGLSNCIFESTSLGTLPDAITGELINGVQITNFNQRVETYEGEVYRLPIIGDRTEKQLVSLEGVIQKHHGKPYEQSNWQLASAELDILPWHKNKPDDTSLFCSETSAITLREMGIMQKSDVPANEFTPSDFAGEIDLCDGYSFGVLEQLK